MAWAKAERTAADYALMQADKPVLGGCNLAALVGATASWRTARTLAAGSDASATGQPARYAIDAHPHKRTYPNANGTTWHLLFDLGTTIAFNGVVIPDHNLNGSGLSLFVADDNAFSVRLENAISTTVATTKRYASLTLFGGNGYLYSGVRYLGITITNGVSFTPYLGELWLLRGRQLPAKPDEEYDPDETVSPAARSEAISGVVASTARGLSKRRLLDAQFTFDVQANIDDFKAWGDDTDGGRSSFVWFEKPGTAPSEAYICKLDRPEIALRPDGQIVKRPRLLGKEVGGLWVKREV